MSARTKLLRAHPLNMFLAGEGKGYSCASRVGTRGLVHERVSSCANFARVRVDTYVHDFI